MVLVVWAGWDSALFDIAHLNEIAGDTAAAHLLKLDSVHEYWVKAISANDDMVLVDDTVTNSSRNKDFNDTDWRQYNIDIAIECTGQLKSKEALSPYFTEVQEV
jgi:glyceraldehyde-3-phosphate dehydrogenase/erythrose-4-phosphate dehydrogenase